MRRTITLAVGLTLLVAAAGCSGTSGDTPPTAAGTTAATVATTTSGAGTSSTSTQGGTAFTYSRALDLSYDLTDLDASWDESSSSFITLADGSVRFDGAGATASAGKVTIESAGTYVVNGTATDAQIVVDCKEHGLVRLVLNGAHLTCASSAPLYVKNAEKVIVILADGTQNFVTDGPEYELSGDSDEPNAAIFSKADLTINGSGSLSVAANYNDGITSKDQLRIVSGELQVQAKNDAIKGKDCLGIKAASITVTAGGDGLQSTNDTDPEKGFVCISGGILDLAVGADGVQAETTLLVTGGDLSLVTGGGNTSGRAHLSGFGPGGSATTTSAADPGDTTSSASQKGLKAAGGVFIEAGNVTIDSADDSLHSNRVIKLTGGDLKLASGDDAVHADSSVTIDGGTLDISTCYEGIESNAITLNGGTVRLVSTDDGLNGVSNADASAASTATSLAVKGNGAGFPGETGNAALTINGVYLVVDAGGDGVDINGTIRMTKGTVIVNGPTSDGNGAIDYLSEFTVTGGVLIAAGSAGMAEAPSESSTEYSIMVNFDSVQAAGTLVHIQDQSGQDILTMAPTKQYQSIVVCSPDIKKDTTYTVLLGGSSTGQAGDTVFAGGAYSGGTEYASLTTSGMVTVSGSAGGMRGGSGGFGGGQGGGPRGGGPTPTS